MTESPTKNDVPSELTGVIPRVERQEKHYEFLWRVRPPATVVNLRHARRIIAHDDSFFPPDCAVILTTTIADDDLATYTFEDELRIIRELNPDYVIPFDFPVYGDMDADIREDHIDQIAQGCRDMAIILSDLRDSVVDDICDQKDLPKELVAPTQDTRVLPLVKGFSQHEREVLYDVAHEIGAPCLVKYGVQYMTVGESGHFVTLRDDLETIQEESNDYPVLVIGVASPTGKYSLEQLPNNVIGGVGTNQWKKRLSTPTDADPVTLQSEFASLYNTAVESLDTQYTYRPLAGREPEHVFQSPEDLSKNPGGSITQGLDIGVAGAAGDEEYGFGQRKRPDDAMDAIDAGTIGGKQSPGGPD